MELTSKIFSSNDGQLTLYFNLVLYNEIDFKKFYYEVL